MVTDSMKMRRFARRVAGNFLVAFISPLMGSNALGVEFEQTVYLSLVSSIFVVTFVIGVELKKNA